jgi:hypothetical protein
LLHHFLINYSQNLCRFNVKPQSLYSRKIVTNTKSIINNLADDLIT